MGVCYEYPVELGQVVKRNSRSAYARKKPSKRSIEIRVGQESFATDLN